jgi:hypothetical protein
MLLDQCDYNESRSMTAFDEFEKQAVEAASLRLENSARVDELVDTIWVGLIEDLGAKAASIKLKLPQKTYKDGKPYFNFATDEDTSGNRLLYDTESGFWYVGIEINLANRYFINNFLKLRLVETVLELEILVGGKYRIDSSSDEAWKQQIEPVYREISRNVETTLAAKPWEIPGAKPIEQDREVQDGVETSINSEDRPRQEFRPTTNRVVALVVGIENYQLSPGGASLSKVHYAHNDADAFEETLRMIYPENQLEILKLKDSEATHASLELQIHLSINSLQEKDSFIFYYAGHGFHGAGGNRITAWDSNSINPEANTLLLQQVIVDKLRESPCQRALMFIDACATNFKAFGRAMTAPLDPTELNRFLTSARYRALFLSCEPGQKSYPSDDLKHGVWTYFLIKALRGEAVSAIEDDGHITDVSLRMYLQSEVSRFVAVNKIGTGIQTPQAITEASSTFSIRYVSTTDIQSGVGHLKEASRSIDLISLGDEIFFEGKLKEASTEFWTFSVKTFVQGNQQSLEKYAQQFEDDRQRFFVTSTEMGSGRTMARKPSWQFKDSEWTITIPIEPVFQNKSSAASARGRMDPNPFDEKHEEENVAFREIEETLRVEKGDLPLKPNRGSHVRRYLKQHGNSPLLSRYIQLEVIRLAFTPNRYETQPQLKFVDRVVEAKVTIPFGSFFQIELDVEMQGLGRRNVWLMMRLETEEEEQAHLKRRQAINAVCGSAINIGKVEPVPVTDPKIIAQLEKLVKRNKK